MEDRTTNRPMTVTEKLPDTFKYHPPTPEQQIQYERIRTAAKVFAEIVVHNTPQCADQSAAVRHIREAVMTANAAVALNGLW